MNSFMEQYVERCAELANVPRSKLNAAPAPSLDDKSLSGQVFEQPGELVAIAAKVIMNFLYPARQNQVRLDSARHSVGKRGLALDEVATTSCSSWSVAPIRLW